MEGAVRIIQNDLEKFLQTWKATHQGPASDIRSDEEAISPELRHILYELNGNVTKLFDYQKAEGARVFLLIVKKLSFELQLRIFSLLPIDIILVLTFVPDFQKAASSIAYRDISILLLDDYRLPESQKAAYLNISRTDKYLLLYDSCLKGHSVKNLNFDARYGFIEGRYKFGQQLLECDYSQLSGLAKNHSKRKHVKRGLTFRLKTHGRNVFEHLLQMLPYIKNVNFLFLGGSESEPEMDIRLDLFDNMFFLQFVNDPLSLRTSFNFVFSSVTVKKAAFDLVVRLPQLSDLFLDAAQFDEFLSFPGKHFGHYLVRSISQTFVTCKTIEHFDNQLKISSLTLNNQDLTGLGKAFGLSTAKHLKLLDMSHSGLQSVDVLIFSNLQSLCLTGNRLSDLKNIAGLGKLKELKELHLANCNLAHVVPPLSSKIEKFPSIKLLNVSNNWLRTFENIGKAFCNVEEIWAKNCLIRDLSMLLVPSLRHVDIRNNNFPNLTFPYGSNFATLNLSGNFFMNHTKLNFSPNALTQIDLSNCKLTSFEILLNGMVFLALKILNLRDNALNFVDALFLRSVPNLEIFDLTNNLIYNTLARDYSANLRLKLLRLKNNSWGEEGSACIFKTFETDRPDIIVEI